MKRTAITKRGPGQPSKLTPESKHRLLSALRQGNYIKPSCIFAGIDVSTFLRWLDRGRREGKGEYYELCLAVEEAEAEAEIALVAAWRAHAPADYRASSLMLARRHPDRWAPREVAPSEVTVKIKHADDRDNTASTTRRTKRDIRK